ncbi:p21-activated protein kinase-interacting protein 1, partial [Eschrichtius robustus]|nr:p21-activated protein kinase-interacting protein 1 [Eschrichtius robustus]
TITCLKFHGNRHLISGAEDGLICVWDAKKWECLKSIKAHKGHVTFLSIHPSGKLALSVGTDKTLRTWNLVEGRSAFIKNIKQNAHIVEWSPRGEKYVVVILNKIDVYQLDTASVSGTITNEKRVSSVRFLSESVLAVAGDEEVVRFFDCDSLMCLSEFKAHENRVKDMFSFETPEHHLIVTASSDGFIKMWKLKEDKSFKIQPRTPFTPIVTSGTLAGIMGMRFYHSGKFMPAGLIAGASLLMVAKLGISVLGKPHE